MVAKAVRYIIFGQICFYIGLTVAILLKPDGLATNNGISYYGIYERTFVPYALGLLGCAFFIWLAATRIRQQKFKIVSYALIVQSILVLVIIVTPYSVSNTLDYSHTAAGSALFSLQLLLSFWLVTKLKWQIWSVALVAVELAAGIACALYLKPTHGFLIQCQILFQVAFGLLLTLGLAKLLPSEEAQTS